MEAFQWVPEWIRWHPEPLQVRGGGDTVGPGFRFPHLNASRWFTVEAPEWSFFSDLQAIPRASLRQQSGAFTVKSSWKGQPRQVNSRFT